MRASVLGHDVFFTTSRRGAPPGRPPMLTLHGGPGFDHTYVARGLDMLSDEIDLIYYDQLGNGRSERPASFEGGIDMWANEADALRASLGHERIVLFGHSFGSFIAIEYALRYGDRLAGLILCSSSPAMDYPDVMMEQAKARATPEQFEAVARAMTELGGEDDEAYSRRWKEILPVYLWEHTPALEEAMTADVKFSAAALTHGFGKCLPSWNTVARLGEIKAPTLILTGRHDWITPPLQGGERLKAGIEGSQLVIFEQSGHYPFFEEPELFQTIVRSWLRRIV